jgi:hypothetical protein
VIAALADLEAPHVSLLELVVVRCPRWGDGGEVIAERWVRRDYPDGWEDRWTAGARVWTTPHAGRARPNLAPVLPSLWGTLQRHGLVAQNDNLPKALKDFTEALEKEQRRKARSHGQATPQGIAVPNQTTRRRVAPETSWSPTPLGERAHAYLVDAGANAT